MADAPQSASLGSRTVQGAAWSAASRAGQQLLQTASTAVLARLLGPGAYGVMAMANFFINFLQQISDLGTGAAVIQRDHLDDGLLDSIFWFNVSISLAAAGLLWAIAPLAVTFYREPQVAPVLRALTLSVLLTGAGIVQQSLLVRRMEYRKLAIVELASGFLAAIVAIVLAWRGAGVWSLVGASITSSGVTAGLSWLFSGWRPRLRGGLGQVRSVASFSLNLSAFTLVNYFARNAGQFVVGRYLGAAALGYFQLSYSLMLYPIQNVSGVLGRVMFSAFARMQGDPGRLRSSYVRVIAVIAAITTPMMLGMFVTVEPLVRVFLGARWLPVVPLVTVLAPVGLLQAITSPVGQIYMATGRTDLMFRVGLASSAAQVIAYLAGLPWGVEGVVAAYAAVNVLLFFPLTAVPFRLIRLRYRPFFSALRAVLGFSAAMAGIAALWRAAIEAAGVHSPLAVLLSTSLVGAAAYTAMLLAGRPAVLADLLRPLSGTGLAPLRRFAERFGPAA
jgi:PST family polysaccharide transporter